MKKIFYLTMTVLLLHFSMNAQIVDTARFRLEYTPNVPTSQKINHNPVIQDTASGKVNVEYNILPQRMDVTFTPSQVEAARMSADAMKPLYRNYLRIGFGYPLTPLFDLAIHNPDNKKYSYGLNVHHFSSWMSQTGKTMSKFAYSPTSDTRLHLFFTRFFKKQTLYSSIGYNHEYAMLYGFNKDSISYLPDYERYYERGYRDTLNNSFHHAKAEIGLRSNAVLGEKVIKHDTRLNYDLIRTHQKDMENHVGINSFIAYDARFLKLSGSQNYKLGMSLDYYNNRWNDTILTGDKRMNNSVKFELKPTINFTIKEYHLLFGLGLPIINAHQKTRVPIYPVAEIQLGLVPGIMNIYFGVDGKSQYNSLQDLLYENPYIKPQLDTLKFTRTQINLYAGIKGNLVKKLNYHIFAQYAFNKDHHFYMIDTTSLLKNQFDIIYKDVNALKASVNLNWEVIDQLYLNLDASYNFYDFRRVVDTIEERAWYKPSWEMAFSGKYVFKQKMIFSANFNLQFGAWALVPNMENVFEAKKMGPVLDFGLGFEYMISKRFSAFAKANNIAFQRYARYYDFKNFGLNVLVGVTYSFGDESLKKSKR